MRVLLTLLIMALGLSAVPAASAPREPYVREGWVAGVAYGPARAKIQGSDSLNTEWLEGPAQSIRLGRMLNPSVMVSYEHQAWLREQGFQELKIRAGVQLEALGVTAYPGRPGTAWNGLYLTAGGGYAHCRLTFLEPLAPGESPIGNTYEPIFTEDEFGWGWYGGLGYEFRISRSFAAGVLMTYNRVEIGGSIYDNAQFVPLVASLNWNF